ncbi:MAG: ABC transporter permease [Anaerolineales bacterium]
MRKVFDIAITDLRLFFSSRGNLVGLLLIPMAMSAVVGFALSGGSGPSSVQVDVVDHDQSDLSAQFLDAIRSANSSLILCPMDNDEEDICEYEGEVSLDRALAIERLEESKTFAVIEVPAGFEKAVRSFAFIDIGYLSDESLSAPGFIQQAVDSALKRINGAVVASRVGTYVLEGTELFQFDQGELNDFSNSTYDRAAKLWIENPVRVSYELTASEEEESGRSVDGFGQSVPGMGSMYVMFTVFGGMVTMVGERKQWTLQRLVVMPVSRAQLLGGKILGRFILGLLQYVAVFAVGIVVGLNFGQDLLALFLTMVIFTLAVTSLSLALGTRLKSEQQAGGLTNLLGLILAPLGGAWWSLEIVPEFMRVVGHVSPVAWAMDAYRSLIFENGDLSTILIPLAVLLGFSAVCFGIGIRWFKYE